MNLVNDNYHKSSGEEIPLSLKTIQRPLENNNGVIFAFCGMIDGY
jgi:hypothetical protein